MIGTSIHRSICLLAGFSSLILLVLAGCGGPGLATVEGKVTMDGQPVIAGRVIFNSEDGKTAIIAKIAPDGSYRALDVPCDTMKITVTPLEKIERIRAQRGTKGKNSGVSEAQAEALEATARIPEKYSNAGTSGLTFTVKSGTNLHNIEISSKE